MEWFQSAANLRRFAFWNIWFWFAQFVVIVPIWFFVFPESWHDYGVFYLVEISVIALWLSALSWWQSARVEEQVTPDE